MSVPRTTPERVLDKLTSSPKEMALADLEVKIAARNKIRASLAALHEQEQDLESQITKTKEELKAATAEVNEAKDNLDAALSGTPRKMPAKRNDDDDEYVPF